MSASEINYFVCTLGEAAQDGISRPFTAVNNLITQQALQNPGLPAIGFYDVTQDNNGITFAPKVLTFKQVGRGIARTARLLSDLLDLKDGQPVGLLAASSPEFFFTWLACIWLGHPVLLIAPQCSAAAIAHLCKVCEVTVLLTDEKHKELTAKARRYALNTDQRELDCLVMPNIDLDEISNINEEESNVVIAEHSTADSNDIAYLHHTSGTSSGLPKSIPQTHHGAVGVLPQLDGRDAATFTTTPLYHGGPADIFRAWSSDAMIWLFPSKDVPITARNVTQCLQVAQRLAQSDSFPSIKYFTSVPYILQMMAEDEEGLALLQTMDLVGVGGAALATEVGDELVAQDVNLVSRFGSAECGFLLSSHRDYNKDRAWQYLRHRQTVSQITFESQDEANLHELVVRSDWPHMAKRNREDGSYATSDLFAKHPDIPGAWRYHSRADSQLTLVTGKKFDPAPLEIAILATSSLLSDVLLFGNGKPYPGVLLFRSGKAKSATSEEVLAGVVPAVEKLNAESQSHARIPRNMLVVMPFIENPLEKSSKGTISRKMAEESYEEVIEDSYRQILDNTNRDVSDEDLPDVILDLVKSIVGDDQGLDAHADLFSQGVDSVACVQIRHGLSLLLPEKARKLPLTVVEDARTVDGLAELVKNVRSGSETGTKDDQRKYIPELIRQYAKLSAVDGPKDEHRDMKHKKLKILLTGPTGSLGAHVLANLLTRPDIEHVYLLVRGASSQAARGRVLKSLSSRQLPATDSFDQKVTILQCKLSEPDLGLSRSDYETLQRNVDLIFHLAWSVNFLLSLRSFAPHFAGIQNLLRLSLSSSKPQPPRLMFCSSVASVSALKHPPTTNGHTKAHNTISRIPESIVPDIQAAGPIGYALSKLTAELLLTHVATTTPSLHKRITIIRVGQLSADTQHGVWNKSEAYPQILASAKFTGGILPDLGVEEQLTWLPVDIAAAAFIEAGLTSEEAMENMPSEHSGHIYGKREDTVAVLAGEDEGKGEADGKLEKTHIDTSAVRVLHLLNPHGRHTFTDFLGRLQDLGVSIHRPPNYTGQSQSSSSSSDNASACTITSPREETDKEKSTIQIVPVQEWLNALEALQSSSSDHSAPNDDKKVSAHPDDKDKTELSTTTSQTKQPQDQIQAPTTTSAAVPLLRLLPFWKQTYATRQPSPSPSSFASTLKPSHTEHPTQSPFRMHNSLLSMPSLTSWLGRNTLEIQGGRYGGGESKDQGGDDLDQWSSELLREEYVRRVWGWVSGNVP